MILTRMCTLYEYENSVILMLEQITDFNIGDFNAMRWRFHCGHYSWIFHHWTMENNYKMNRLKMRIMYWQKIISTFLYTHTHTHTLIYDIHVYTFFSYVMHT